jgi:trimeric autotransporter adhesin
MRGAVRRIRSLRGVTWQWREDVAADVKETPAMGVLAQDVEAVFPELVTVDERGFKTVYYPGLIAPLIEAVKELDERLRAIEERLDELSPPG